MKLFVTAFLMHIWCVSPISGHIIKVNEHLYGERVSNDLAYVMEKVTEANVNLWQKYFQGPKYPRDEDFIQQQTQKQKDVFNTGASCCYHIINRDVLEHFEDADVWIAYLSQAPQITPQENLQDMIKYIEMSVSVTTDPDTPFTTHMGISRSLYHHIANCKKQDSYKVHPRQSLKLHAFSAAVSAILDDSKIYMITAPLKEMAEILFSSLEAGEYFIGDNNFRDAMNSDLNQGTLYQFSANGIIVPKVRKYIKNHPSPFSVTLKDDWPYYTLQNNEGQSIWELSLNRKKQFWFKGINNSSYYIPLVIIKLDALAGLLK